MTGAEGREKFFDCVSERARLGREGEATGE